MINKIQKVLYEIKCFLFKRYTRIKPRNLGYGWVDKVSLLPNLMFEVLAQFVEKEKPEEIVEWYGTYGAKINNIYVMDEIKDLYKWWIDFFIPYQKEELQYQKDLWGKILNNSPIRRFKKLDNGNYERLLPKFKDKKQKKDYYESMKALRNFEEKTEKILQENLHRLVNIIPYMWV